jgi:F-type H+-transporting ATPase subunit epsilon
MGIQYGHAPLLTKLKPGAVKVVVDDSHKEYFYISGGMLEIQPNCVTILADMAERADDLDEQAVLRAQKRAQELINNASKDASKVQLELARAVAQLKVIQELRNKDV